MSDHVTAIIIVFMTVVMPIWIVFHYGTRWRSMRGLAAQDEKMLADLWDAARRMEDRLANLERVLGPEPQERKP